MSELLIYSIGLFLLFVFELCYFSLADHFNIIDKPNHRSSHSRITIRGGGIVFPIAVLGWFIYSGLDMPFFMVGLLLIALISFIDDVSTLKSGIRSLVHLFSVALVLFELGLPIEWYYLMLILILIVGSINAYNFMDGINGITGAYSMVLLSTFFYFNRYVQTFISETLLAFALLSVLVFNYFNFRRVAKCFAGDVGSVSIAFIICFILARLIVVTSNLSFIAFLLVYGLDAVSTIIFRLIKRENITEAHRSHFYQFLANEKGWPHLRVASLYALLQLGINMVVIQFFGFEVDENLNIGPLMVLAVVAGIGFVWLRVLVEGKGRVFGRD